MMICVSVIYPATPDSKFDRSYYLAKHIPFANSAFEPYGLKRTELVDGKPGIDGSKPAYHLMANLYFGSLDGLQTALATRGPEVMADIPNYTNAQPIIYVGEVVA
jgi:uncharacterized protein (TIGR02118 family)